MEIATTLERENASKEREKHETEIASLKAKLQQAESAKRDLQEKSKAKFDQAREGAISRHEQLAATAKKFQEQLDSAKAKLDHYRRESYERESKLRQNLRAEQPARAGLEKARDKLVEELTQVHADLVEQKQEVEDSLMISEAAVAAADRREAELREALEQAQGEIAQLIEMNSNVDNVPEAGGVELAKQEAREVMELQNQIVALHQKHESERQQERIKWDNEIAALQQALETARSHDDETHLNEGARKPNLLRRIGRKIMS